LDRLTSGFQPSELVIVAARPSMGKTALCLNIATHAAVENFGVAIFSLEMSRDQLVQRLITAEGRVDSQRVRQGSLRDSDFTNLARAAGVLQSCPIWIDDTPSITLLEMRSKARRLKAENDIKMVVVDYLQLMRSPEYAENRVQEISDISRSLKALARELEVPVVALSQLSRASEQRGGERKPILSDLRDSGAIEQDADLVLFIHRPEYYDREDEAKKGLAEIMLAKNRNGPTGDVHLRFNREYTRFDSFSQRDEPE
jgi:replicative DNA helicase